MPLTFLTDRFAAHPPPPPPLVFIRLKKRAWFTPQHSSHHHCLTKQQTHTTNTKYDMRTRQPPSSAIIANPPTADPYGHYRFFRSDAFTVWWLLGHSTRVKRAADAPRKTGDGFPTKQTYHHLNKRCQPVAIESARARIVAHATTQRPAQARGKAGPSMRALHGERCL